jgi:acid phosphatase
MQLGLPASATHALRGALMAATILAAGIGTAGAADTTPQNDLLNATLWMQKSVEYKATTESLFALAKLRLDQALADKSWTTLPDMEGDSYKDKPVAIITDLDETVLDNNVYEASLVTRNSSFSGKEWTQYVKDEVTKATAGAVDFLKYADSKGVKIFYISGRTKEEEPATRENMKKLGFPKGGNVDTVLSQGEKPEWKSAKENRFQVVAKDYRVVLMMGDNLGDFTDKASGTPEERMAFFKASQDHWGHDWIAFPNPEYGSWESTSFGNKWSKPADERRKEKMDRIDPWKPAE